MRLFEMAGHTIRFTMPDAEREFDEAGRYPQLQDISVEEWKRLVAAGKPVQLSPESLATLTNSTATDRATAEENFPDLEPEKQARVKQLLNTGVVEMPIVLKDGDSHDLLAGNTRLTALVKAGISPTVLVVDITNQKVAHA